MRAGGLGAPRGLRAPPAHLEPKAGSSTSSCGTAAPGQRRPARSGKKTLAPDSRKRRTPGVSSPGSSLSARPLSCPPRGGPAPLAGAAPRNAQGKRCPASAPPAPRASSAGPAGEPPCSPLTPGRARRPRPLERRVFNGVEDASAPGATATAAGHGACGTARRRLPCPPRSDPVAPQSCARPAPAIAAGKSGRRARLVPPSAPRPPAAVLLTRPEPPLSRRGIPASSAPLSPPAALAAGAERALPAPSSGGGGPGRAGPGRSQAGGRSRR